MCLRTSLDAMILAGDDIALVARVSCGTYAGPHRTVIDAEFCAMVDEILMEPLQDGLPQRGQYFDSVVIPMLPGAMLEMSHAVQRLAQGSSAGQLQPCRYFLTGSCRYGDGCRFSHELVAYPSI